MEDVHACGRLEVQRDRFLAAVAPDEVRCETAWAVDDVVVVAGEVAAVGVLHLDHASAEVGQHARTHRRGDGLLHCDDGDAGEWRCHITMPPSTGSTCPVM